ncbi:MAG: hypothetical protein R6X25_01655 [Candidatus Krumholzibacteriia bacterium]
MRAGGRVGPAALTIALALVCVGALQAYDQELDRAGRDERLYFPSGRFLREAACGFREMAADYLWFELVQYYGGYRKGEHDMRYFDLLVDAVTRLDPRFVEAYYFSSLVACLDLGDIPRAVAVLRAGILHNPSAASLPFHAGFLYYVFEKNTPRARVWFDAAAAAPEASEFHQRFAAYARRQSGDLNGSLALWRHLAATSASPELRTLAEEHVAKIEAELSAGPAASPPAAATLADPEAAP